MGNEQSAEFAQSAKKMSISSAPPAATERRAASSAAHPPRRSFDQRHSHHLLPDLHEDQPSASTGAASRNGGHSPQRKHSESHVSARAAPAESLSQRRLSCTPKHSVCSLQSVSLSPASSASTLSVVPPAAPPRGRGSFSLAQQSPRDAPPLSADWREEKRSPLLAFCNSYAQLQQQQRDSLGGAGYRRRMSVDESQQRRMRGGAPAAGAAAGGPNESGGRGGASGGAQKHSLAGIPPPHSASAFISSASTTSGGYPSNSFSSSSSSQSSQSSANPIMTNGLVDRSRINKAARDFTETGDFGLTLQEHLKLTSYQTLMLTQTWSRVKASVFTGVFRELSSKCPKVKELFQKTSIVGGFSANKCFDIKEHIKLVIELFDLCLQEMNSPCKTSQDRCIAIGETHFTIIGPSASGIWDDLGVCLTESISKAEAIRGKREAFKAYIALTSFLVDSMKAGYMNQAKRKSLTRMSNGHMPNYGR
ncbi:hypothetical protein M3Y99_00604300 [Aphelenchoides fujianensis]|nr:hypothetical protein M3Y99_00604300 [Aphelenchoides fujianensis]